LRSRPVELIGTGGGGILRDPESRCRGVQGIGIASLMGQLGHGGFYAHFDNKDDLVVAAAGQMLEEGLARMIAAAEAAPEAKNVRAIVHSYLSTGHRDRVSHVDVCSRPWLVRWLASRGPYVARTRVD
jgi:AcrR family transcriptional regulator